MPDLELLVEGADAFPDVAPERGAEERRDVDVEAHAGVLLPLGPGERTELAQRAVLGVDLGFVACLVRDRADDAHVRPLQVGEQAGRASPAA